VATLWAGGHFITPHPGVGSTDQRAFSMSTSLTDKQKFREIVRSSVTGAVCVAKVFFATLRNGRLIAAQCLSLGRTNSLLVVDG
jgi:hypothetical protein